MPKIYDKPSRHTPMRYWHITDTYNEEDLGYYAARDYDAALEQGLCYAPDNADEDDLFVEEISKEDLLIAQLDYLNLAKQINQLF